MLTDKQQEAIDYMEKYGSRNRSAKELGISRQGFSARLDAALAKINKAPIGMKMTKYSESLDSDGNVTGQAKQFKIAPEHEEVTPIGPMIRNSVLEAADGSVTAQWKIYKNDKAEEDFVKALDKHFTKKVKRSKLPNCNYIKGNDDDLAVFFSVDEHINVKLYKDIVGIDYGLEDAIDLMESSFEKLVSRTPKSKKCLYLNLGDQFHQNDHMNVTPASKHMLDSDMSFETASDAVVSLQRRRIELLASHYELVDLRGVNGNHDEDPMGWLFRCLDIAYEKEDRISVQYDKLGMGAYKHGNCMLGYHHGHKMKPEVLCGALTDEFSEMYGKTYFRYAHTGHFHHDKVKDMWGGWQHVQHRTMSPKDDFSFSGGYRSRQSMHSAVYNKEEGEVNTPKVSLIP